MPIFDRITHHSVSVLRSSLVDATRHVRLRLESGGTASISFVATLPADFLRFSGPATSLFMTADQFADVHRLLRSGQPAFFTALDLLGIRTGSVHTQLDLDDAPDGEGSDPLHFDPHGLEALIRHARRLGTDRA
jgi:hypothetical protein